MCAMYVGAYWQARPESAEECAERLSRFLQSLARAHPALTNWFRKGQSRAKAVTPIEPSVQALSELLMSGRARRDVDGEFIDELGFTGGMWNRSTPSVGLTFHCGASYMPIGNNVVLQLPSMENGGASLVGLTSSRAIINAVVEAWNPEWATWTTDEWRNAQSAAPGEPVAGWLTYIRHLQPSALPADLTTTPVGDGVLVRAAATFSAMADERARAVRQALGSAGVLRSGGR